MNRHFLLSALFISFSFLSFGQGYQVQSKYFVYLQTEPAQPFYIKINGQRISANASGYLILPQLKDGDYKLVVGFSDNKTPEQRFDFKIDSKDKGYLIKDYGADGWGLFDLQTMVVQKSIKGNDEEVVAKAPTPPPAQKQETPVATVVPETKTEAVPAENVSDFTKVLSQAANDPSLLEKPKPQPVEEEQPAVVQSEPPVEENTAAATPQNNPVQTVPENQNNTSASAKMVRLVYDDRNEMGQVDPVTIYIPEPANATTKEAPAPVAKAPVKAEKKAEVEEKVSEPEVVPDNFQVEEKPAIPQGGEEGSAMAKSNNESCKSIATNDDFLKLRRSMASQSNDDDMIAQASKAFKTKCYTTSQIKYLSGMFLSNAGKYNFYTAAYPFTSDRENFASLESEISDGPYKDRFKKLLQ